MPLFAFSKQWLNPHLSLSQRLFVGFAVPVGGCPIQIRLEERTPQMSSAFTVGTGGFHRTGMADFSICPVDILLFTVTAFVERKFLTLWTGKNIAFRVIVKTFNGIK